MTTETAPKREQSGLPLWVKILIGFSLIGFTALLVGGMVLIGSLRSEKPPIFLEHPQPTTTAEIESVARIDIPDTASNIRAAAGGFQDRYIHVRFDLPPADLERFLTATKYTPTLTEGGSILFQQSIEPQEAWWQPHSATRFLSGRSFVDGISQTVLVDISNPALYTVYVATFET